MVYGLIADTHLHGWSSFATKTAEGHNSRLIGLLDEIERCAAEVADLGGECLVFAGDMFHVRGSVQPSVLNLTRQTLGRICDKYGLTLYILAGNHDLEGRNSAEMTSAVTALKDDNIYCHSDQFGYWANLGVYGARHRPALMIPWFESVEQLKKAIAGAMATLPKGELGETDLILHAPIDGVIPGLPEHGLTPEFLAGLGFKRVFAGHYHNHKQFPGNVYSIGALAHHTWSDVGSRAGFLIVGNDVSDVRYRASRLPQFVKITDGMGEEEMLNACSGNFVKIETGPLTEVESKDLSETLKTTYGAKAVLINSKPSASASLRTATTKSAATSTIEESVVDYAMAMPTFAEEFRKIVSLDALQVLEMASQSLD